ncbi:tetratricopeptide repeat protein [Pleionea litopenaei]|uniref:Tetratricopeptide repeat protein n=1 Tax=Pleionea litopenaei TaxID=3070815 RepID=A0AA51X572_9GAMM|nr:hypothetical protein [Pleionea sp. HL-JVS1]WMS85582.1 hypothetical protein Q9312_10190 [Pleionea sp. HL-JVS1]
MVRYILLVSLSAFLGLISCTSQPVQIQTLKERESRLDWSLPSGFDNTTKIPDETQLFSLSDAQINEFKRFLKKKDIAVLPGHQQVSEYLKTMTANFNYYGKTFLASDAFRLQKGNCMALAILTTAIANVHNIDIDYEKIHAEPVYQKQGSIVIRGDHVRSKLIDPNFQLADKAFVIEKPSIVVDYFPSYGGQRGAAVKRAEFLAMIYSNLAAEAYVEKDYNTSYYSAKRSLNYDQNYAPSINILALTLKRKGHLARAEKVFQYGYQKSPINVELLSNYKDFLVTMGNQALADKVDQKLRSVDLPNPFDYIKLGFDYLDREQPKLAEEIFRKATVIAPYLHQSYFGLALTYLQMDQSKDAQYWLEKAMSSSFQSEIREQYRAKIQAISIGNG